MRISWQYTGNEPIKLKTFIRNQGISRHLMAKVRSDGGKVLINGVENRRIDKINPQTVLTIKFPSEENRKNDLIPSYVPLKILYEYSVFVHIYNPLLDNEIASLHL